MSRRFFGFLATALLALTACSAPAAVHAGAARTSARSAPATPAAHSAARHSQPVDVLSASFASSSVGWALAQPQCAGQGEPCKATALMRKTTDGGRTWFSVAAPSVPAAFVFQPSQPPNSVSRILFTSSRDGWAYGLSLWHTTDGSASWQRVPVPGPVADFAVTGGRLVAVIGACDTVGSCAFRGYSAPAGTDHWAPLPGTAIRSTEVPLLAVSGGTGFLVEGTLEPQQPLLLSGPVTGSARWRALSMPCPASWSDAIAAVPGSLFLGCGSEPGAGNQQKSAYLSADGGRTWHRLASPPFGGYLGAATMTSGGTIFLSGGRMDLYISRDRGRSWQRSPSLADAAGLADAGFELVGTTVTDAFGVAVQQDVFTRQLWLTGDGGRHWAAITLH